MRIFSSVSVHRLFFFFGAVLDNSSLVELAGESVDNKLNMHHPPWWENTSTMITQRRIKVSLAKVENNTKHKTIMPSFLLPDGLFAVRTITSFIHDCNRYCANASLLDDVTITRSAHHGKWNITQPQADISVIFTSVTERNHAFSHGN